MEAPRRPCPLPGTLNAVTTRPDPEERITTLLQDNTAVNDLLRRQAEESLTNLHRPIEQLGVLLSRPAFIVTAAVLFLLWILLNLDLKLTTHRPWDEPPFYWLQGLIGALSLLVTCTVLVSQARQAQMAEQRAQLQLQFVVLIEQRSAKIVQLLEELRQDLPNVRDRVDPEAEVMGLPTRPEAILEAMETLADAGGTALPPASTDLPAPLCPVMPDTGGVQLQFSTELIEWRGPAPYLFAPVPEAEADAIRAAAALVTYGWGMIPVRASIGDTGWRTSLFPKDGRYLVPVKVAVQRAETLGRGDRVTVTLNIGV